MVDHTSSCLSFSVSVSSTGLGAFCGQIRVLFTFVFACGTGEVLHKGWQVGDHRKALCSLKAQLWEWKEKEANPWMEENVSTTFRVCFLQVVSMSVCVAVNLCLHMCICGSCVGLYTQLCKDGCRWCLLCVCMCIIVCSVQVLLQHRVCYMSRVYG